MIVLVFLLGLVFGSFISVLAWRLPRNLDFVNDRSRCPNCNHKLNWYFNIPLLSYLYLKGKCHYCHKNISFSYPFIELSTGILFTLNYLFLPNILKNIPWLANLKTFSLLYLFLLTTILITLFLIDLKHQILPDNLIFVMLLVTVFSLLISNYQFFYLHILSGFLAASFFLFLNLVTFGKGMGLGDAKLALLVGLVAGPQLSLTIIFMSFIIGGLVGLVLLSTGFAKFGQKIPFGPFLITSFFLVLLFNYGRWFYLS